MTTDPTPDEFRGVTPHLVVADAEAAIAFYGAVFGADEFRRAHGPDGRVWHVELLIGGGRLLLLEAYPEVGMLPPDELTAATVMLHIYVEDTDEVFASAVAAGATPLMEPWDSFWGDRYAQIKDPFGHRWAIATRHEDLDDPSITANATTYIEEIPDAPL